MHPHPHAPRTRPPTSMPRASGLVAIHGPWWPCTRAVCMHGASTRAAWTCAHIPPSPCVSHATLRRARATHAHSRERVGGKQRVTWVPRSTCDEFSRGLKRVTYPICQTSLIQSRAQPARCHCLGHVPTCAGRLRVSHVTCPIPARLATARTSASPRASPRVTSEPRPRVTSTSHVRESRPRVTSESRPRVTSASHVHEP